MPASPDRCLTKRSVAIPNIYPIYFEIHSHRNFVNLTSIDRAAISVVYTTITGANSTEIFITTSGRWMSASMGIVLMLE